MSKQDKKQQKNFISQNPLESLENIIQGTVSQVFGIEPQKSQPQKESGELHEGEALDLRKAKDAAIEPGINYGREIVNVERTTSRKAEHTMQGRIEEILFEIKKLVSSSQELEAQFKDVVVETPIVKPGKYHENFFEWVFSVIKTARMRIEESTGWLSAMHSKKDKKYWAMFKKHGTTFGLSNERVVSTQTG